MKFQRLLAAPLLVVLSTLLIGAVEARPLRVGITLHPYYSFVANIVGDRAEILPLIEAGNNPHNYRPRAEDMRRVMNMDVLVVNGIGHDEWAFEIIQAAGREEKLPLIYANSGVPLIPIAADEGEAKVVNPHTFVSVTVAIQQIYTIARELGKLDPGNAVFFRKNARDYTLKLRRMKAKFMGELVKLNTSNLRCATMHGAYGYLMQEFGLQVVAVIEPRHGVSPTARQLGNTIDKIKAANVNVLFAEKFFASNLADTIREATGISMYAFSHMSDGDYSPELFERETRANLETLVKAMRVINTETSASATES